MLSFLMQMLLLLRYLLLLPEQPLSQLVCLPHMLFD